MRSIQSKLPLTRAYRAQLAALLGGAFLALGNGASEPAAQEPVSKASCADAVAARVQSYYDGVRNLSARFSQSSKVASLGSHIGGDHVAAGHVDFAKPGKMRWAYQEPQPSLVVSDGETLWMYDATLGEAQRLTVDQGFLSGAAIQFLLGEGDLLKTFRASAPDCDSETVLLHLLPRQESTYEHLELDVQRETGVIVETRVFDLFGNITGVAFHDVVTDRELPADHFQFVPPPGTDVIEIAPPK